MKYNLYYVNLIMLYTTLALLLLLRLQHHKSHTFIHAYSFWHDYKYTYGCLFTSRSMQPFTYGSGPPTPMYVVTTRFQPDITWYSSGEFVMENTNPTYSETMLWLWYVERLKQRIVFICIVSSESQIHNLCDILATSYSCLIPFKGWCDVNREHLQMQSSYYCIIHSHQRVIKQHLKKLNTLCVYHSTNYLLSLK